MLLEGTPATRKQNTRTISFSNVNCRRKASYSDVPDCQHSLSCVCFLLAQPPFQINDSFLCVVSATTTVFRSLWAFGGYHAFSWYVPLHCIHILCFQIAMISTSLRYHCLPSYVSLVRSKGLYRPTWLCPRDKLQPSETRESYLPLGFSHGRPKR